MLKPKRVATESQHVEASAPIGAAETPNSNRLVCDTDVATKSKNKEVHHVPNHQYEHRGNARCLEPQLQQRHAAEEPRQALLRLENREPGGDIANYNAEFTALTNELTSLGTGKFNGVDVFTPGGSTINVITSEDASQTMTLTKSDYAGATGTITGAANLAAITVTDINDAITAVATMRAQNGAEGSRLGFAIEMIGTNRNNLEAANSRIVDTDVAVESTKLSWPAEPIRIGVRIAAK